MSIEAGAKTVSELASHVDGTIVGDSDLLIRSGATLESASEGQVTFLSNRKYGKLVESTKASAIVVPEAREVSVTQIVVPDPYFAFQQIVVLLHGYRKHGFAGISDRASIAQSARIGKDVCIADFVTVSDGACIGEGTVVYPNVFIGPNAKIGDNCIIYPSSVIFDETVVGDRVVIQPNANIGHDGFGFATHKGSHHKIPHIGRVVVEDDVELGAGCAVESGAFDETVIGQGSKVGDHVVVGHGTKIGAGCLIVPQVGLAGSVTLGQYCRLGGQSGVTGHIKVGNNCVIAAKSLVTHELGDGEVVMGFPAYDMNKARKSMVVQKNLPNLRKRIFDLEKRIKDMETKV